MLLRWYHVFLITFAAALIIQSWIWSVDSFTDESLWEKRIEQLRSDLQNPKQLDAWNPVYSGHPGMAIASLGALLSRLNGAVILLNSLSIAASAAVSFSLRPRSLWWIALAATVTAHPLYIRASPTNAVIGPLVVLCIMVLIWLHEHPRSPATTRMQKLLAVAAGLGLATRLETMGLILTGILVVLSKKLGWPRILWIGAAAGATAVIVDPLWWYAPAKHLSFILFRSNLNFTGAVALNTLTFFDFGIGTPLGLLSLGLALLTRPLARRLIASLIVITAIFCVLLLSVRAQSLRHFFPVILLWESLLPLFVWHALSRYRIAQVTAVLALVGSQAFLLWSAL